VRHNFYEHLRARVDRFDEQTLASFGQCAAAVQAGDTNPRIDLAAGLVFAAFSCPSSIEPLYDALAKAWLAEKYPKRSPSRSYAPDLSLRCPVPDTLWDALFSLHQDTSELGAQNLTARVVDLGAELSQEFTDLAERLAQKHRGAARPQDKSIPALIDVESLAQLPTGSLGAELLATLRTNGFEAEVLDRQAIGLAELPAGLRYLNTRILQMHDIWHLVAGYQTRRLHEIGISAFQLAQFGHGYSAMFLASVLSLSCARQPEGLPILLQIISEGWLHGRTTPAFMDIAWEEQWHLSTADIRRTFAIAPFHSELPAGLLESLASAS